MPPTYLLYGFACLVSIIPTITSWIALLAPRYDGIKHTGALAVTPPPNHDGPSIWLGLIREKSDASSICTILTSLYHCPLWSGTCSRTNAAADTVCDQYSTHNLFTDFKYDVSVLPPDAPLFTLRVPSVHLRGLAVTAAVFSTFFTTIAFCMTFSFWYDARDHEKYRQTGIELDRRREDVRNHGVGLNLSPEEGERLNDLAGARVWLDAAMRVANRAADDIVRHDEINRHLIFLEELANDRGANQKFAKQLAQREKLLDVLRVLSAAVSLGFGIIGALTFAILWVHYERACRNFNLIYKRNGTPAIPLEASLGLTFNLAYAGYILAVIPFSIVFYELHNKRDNWRWGHEVGGGIGLWFFHLFWQI